MGFQWVCVSLRGYGGEAPSGDAFFASLGVPLLPHFSLHPSTSAWQAARLILFTVDMRDLQGVTEPSEEFAARVEQGFRRATGWLRQCHADRLGDWRARGKEADIFIGGWLANEQMDLQLPAEFLLECGRLGLPISICTND